MVCIREYNFTPAVTPKTRFHFHIDDDQREALRAVKERDGVPEAEQIRRAIDAWLEQKGVSPKKPPKPKR